LAAPVGPRRHRRAGQISALSELDSVVRCIELGAEDYLPKPFNPLLLKARIGACLEKKRSHDREIAYRREIEHERADRLLHAILPAPAVRELEARTGSCRGAMTTSPSCSLISSISRPIPRRMRPKRWSRNLDCLAHTCEALMAEHGLEKIKTVGDGFVTTGNLLEPLADHLRQRRRRQVT